MYDYFYHDLPEPGSIEESIDILDKAIAQQRRFFLSDNASLPPKTTALLKERMKRFLYNNLKSDDEYLMEVKKKSLLTEKLSNYTILNDAVRMQDSRYVEALIKSGAPLNNPDKYQMTPLEIAIFTNNYELCAMLLYYGCGRFNSRFSSHLIYAICTGSNADIQLLLLNYEADVDSCFLEASILFFAIKHSHFLVPHLLNHGADVNLKNTLYFVFQHPIPLEYFRMIWDKFDFEVWFAENRCQTIMFAALIADDMSDHLWIECLRIVFEDARIIRILESHSYSNLLLLLVQQYYYRKIHYSKYYDVFCILLSTGYNPSYEEVKSTVYFHGKDSWTYKLLSHMELNQNEMNGSIGLRRIQLDFRKPLAHILHFFYKEWNQDASTGIYWEIAKFFTVPERIRKWLEKADPTKYSHIFERYNGSIPPLLELARNRSREFICKKYKIVNAGQYQSVVKHYFDLPERVKGLLTFEQPIY